MTDYDAAIAKLVARAMPMQAAEYTPTPERKALEGIAEQIEELVERLRDAGSVQHSIEAHHNERVREQGRLVRIGFAQQLGVQSDFAQTLGVMYDLAMSAREAAEILPDAREKTALKFAASAFLHIRYRCEFQLPRFSNTSDDVRDFGEVWAKICKCAEPPLSPERLRGALKSAFDEFDPNFVPPGVDEIIAIVM